MKNILIQIILVITFLGLSFSLYQSYKLEYTKRVLKQDAVELSDIKYGMFNVDVWKDQIANIISVKLKEINLTGKNKAAAKVKIKTFLYNTLDKFEASYKEENSKKGFFGFSLRNLGADIFRVFKELKERVPEITEDILTFLDKKENRENIKKYILAEIDKYSSSTFQKVDYSKRNIILKKYRAKNTLKAQKIITKRIGKLDSEISLYNLISLLVFIWFLIIILVFKINTKLSVVVYVLAGFQLLFLGVFLPMIDIDARISLMEFKLMGETISFKNQVLYYKSKSIIEMAEIMLFQSQAKVIVVGILVVIFSVVFPVSKLISSVFLLFNQRAKQNKIIQFLVFKSGKWSMADVMVVAIFMSYIGFSGIISSQLNQLEKLTKNINILTTNNSELQSGFYYFFGFVLLSISISQLLSLKFKKDF